MNAAENNAAPEDVVVRLLEKTEMPGAAERVEALFRNAGWIAEKEPATCIPAMLLNSFCVAGAFHKGRLIGMMRALSDGVSAAYLLDMVVDPAFRGHGVASRILETITSHLKNLGIDWIVCISVPGVEKLYLKLGETMDRHTPIRFH